jgi:hypothetical protein
MIEESLRVDVDNTSTKGRKEMVRKEKADKVRGFLKIFRSSPHRGKKSG